MTTDDERLSVERREVEDRFEMRLFTLRGGDHRG